MKPNLSIHPRASRGGAKVNTCERRSPRNGGQGGKALRRAMKRLSSRIKAWEGIDEKDRAGYRKPGSMKP